MLRCVRDRVASERKLRNDVRDIGVVAKRILCNDVQG